MSKVKQVELVFPFPTRISQSQTFHVYFLVQCSQTPNLAAVLYKFLVLTASPSSSISPDVDPSCLSAYLLFL